MLVEFGEKECTLLLNLLDGVEIQTAFINVLREKLKGVRPPRREKRNTSVTLYADQVEYFAPSELSGELRKILDEHLKKENSTIQTDIISERYGLSEDGMKVIEKTIRRENDE